MTGDFSRSTFDSTNHFDSVLMQQGRVQIDADWNELVAIQDYRNATQTTDMIGGLGTPAGGDGYAITVIDGLNGGYDLAIGPGRFYVNGVQAEQDPPTPVRARVLSDTTLRVGEFSPDGLAFATGQQVVISKDGASPQTVLIAGVDPANLQLTTETPVADPTANRVERIATYGAQPFYPAPPALPAPVKGADVLVYLETWQRVITALEDPEIADVALNGADTAARSQTVAQVKYAPLTAGNGDGTDSVAKAVTKWAAVVASQPRGQMSAQHQASSASSLKNQLYRVEIHGGNFAAVPTPVTPTAVSGATITVPVAVVDSQPWRPGQTLAITATTSQGPVTLLAQIMMVATKAATVLTLDTDLGKLANVTAWSAQRAPTFKWAWDNGSVATRVTSINGAQITIADLGRQTVTGFQDCDWVEITRADWALQETPGLILKVRSINGTLIETELDLSAYDLNGTTGWMIRRWESPYLGTDGLWPALDMATVTPSTGGCVLEDAISVTFSTSALFATGDFWWIVSRTNGESIEWPTDDFGPLMRLPVGPNHAYAPLAALTHDGVKWTVQDLRARFGQSTDFVWKRGDTMTGPLVIERVGDINNPYSLLVSDEGVPDSPLDDQVNTGLKGGAVFWGDQQNSFISIRPATVPPTDPTQSDPLTPPLDALAHLLLVSHDGSSFPTIDIYSKFGPTDKPIIQFTVPSASPATLNIVSPDPNFTLQVNGKTVQTTSGPAANAAPLLANAVSSTAPDAQPLLAAAEAPSSLTGESATSVPERPAETHDALIRALQASVEAQARQITELRDRLDKITGA